MQIHSRGEEDSPVIIMLPGSFCNADTMADIIKRLEAAFHILAVAAFFDGGPFLCFPKAVSRLLGSKFKTIVGKLRGKILEEALREPTIVRFSGGRPERYSSMLGPICRNAAYMSDETLEREADACVTFNYPHIDRDFQRNLYFFYSREESAWRFCHRKLKKAYPYAQYQLVSGYGHVGYPGEYPEEYCGWLSQAAKGERPFTS